MNEKHTDEEAEARRGKALTQGPQAGGRPAVHPECSSAVLWEFPALGFWRFRVRFCLSGPAQRSCFLFPAKTELPERITGSWNLTFRSTASKGLVYVCPQICMGHTLNKYPAVYLKFKFTWRSQQGARGDPVEEGLLHLHRDDPAGHGEQDCGQPSAQKVQLGTRPRGEDILPGARVHLAMTVARARPGAGGAEGPECLVVLPRGRAGSRLGLGPSPWSLSRDRGPLRRLPQER